MKHSDSEEDWCQSGKLWHAYPRAEPQEYDNVGWARAGRPLATFGMTRTEGCRMNLQAML